MTEFAVELRFHDELAALLQSRNFTGMACVAMVSFRRSIKDLIESLGIPHTEVAAVMVNGCGSSLHRVIDRSMQIDLFPCRGEVCYPAGTVPRFVCDVHLGKLARCLRLLGFDTWYRSEADDFQLAALAVHENRVLLTRDRGLLSRRVLRYGLLIPGSRPETQARYLLERMRITGLCRPFARCLICNGRLQILEEIQLSQRERLPAEIQSRFDRFAGCTACGRLFWQGSHHDQLCRRIERLIEDL